MLVLLLLLLVMVVFCLFVCLFIWLIVAESYIAKAGLGLLILLLPLPKTLQAWAMVPRLCSTGVELRVPCMLIKLSINWAVAPAFLCVLGGKKRSLSMQAKLVLNLR